MSEFEHSTQPAESQLQQAMGGVASIIEGMLRRSREIGTQLAESRERQRVETDRLAAMERQLHADRAALEQMSKVFSQAAGRPEQRAGAEAVAPAAEAAPQPIKTAADTAPAAHIDGDREVAVPTTPAPSLQEFLALRGEEENGVAISTTSTPSLQDLLALRDQ
jgi:hypothetical protein